MREERRRRRGDTLGDALRFQLAACVEDEGLEAMALADDQGLCLASWGEGTDCELMAARAPMASAGTRRLRLGSALLFLCAAGGDAQTRRRSLDRSELGVTRILNRWLAS
jgi:hypothetical protein